MKNNLTLFAQVGLMSDQKPKSKSKGSPDKGAKKAHDQEYAQIQQLQQ